MSNERLPKVPSSNRVSRTHDSGENSRRLSFEDVSNGERTDRTSVTTGLSQKIRAKLPGIGNRLRRLMKLKSTEGFEGDVAGGSWDVGVEILEDALNRAVRDTPGEYFPRSAIRPAATAREVLPIETTSNSMNTEETNVNLLDAINRHNEISGNNIRAAAGLSSQRGLQPEASRIQEPQSIPLIYIQNGERHEVYVGNGVNGESEFSGSSTIGSELSSISETEQPETRNQRIGDDLPQFYDTLRTVIRKPICRQDDEPTIY
ncbi:hypothetical protein KM043_002389 [Ampulex compressa]|nr:hypothetical protein KM043_002389 [Ampulex compressa]